jgi:hypothetical protein
MGRRTNFYENITGKCCKDLLKENYKEFCQMLITENSFPSGELVGFISMDTNCANY